MNGWNHPGNDRGPLFGLDRAKPALRLAAKKHPLRLTTWRRFRWWLGGLLVRAAGWVSGGFW